MFSMFPRENQEGDGHVVLLVWRPRLALGLLLCWFLLDLIRTGLVSFNLHLRGTLVVTKS